MNNQRRISNMVALAAIIVANIIYAATPTITDVTAQQQYPLNGKIDISYTVTGNIAEEAKRRAVITSLKVTAIDMDANTINTASKLSGDLSLEEGTHTVVWDMDAEGISFNLENANIKVSCEMTNATYCVIDLSEGANASYYPVTYMVEPPSGGFNVDEYKTAKLVLKRIEAGSFIMGADQKDESRRVTHTKPFFCGIFEVTQKQYQQIMGSNPSAYNGDMRPVDSVSYNMIRGSSNGAQWPSSSDVDDTSFIGKLRKRTNQDFDIPTNAQWEYACRAGTKSKYNNGGDTENDLRELGRYVSNQSDGKGGYESAHTTVGSYRPNNWGLYDMHGNVWEWCLDWYGVLASGNDPTGSSSGSNRILRGGTWKLSADRCTPSDKGDDFWPTDVYDDTGFRLVRTLPVLQSNGTLCSGTHQGNVHNNVCIVTEGSTNGYTMTDGNTYVVQNSVAFSNTTAGGSGMSVADNATVVLYVPSDITLTATGANGIGQTGGGAGIHIPASSTLIITGDGVINATGGNGGDGGNGTNGTKGSSISKLNGQKYVQGSGGEGGAGGNGGGGAGAGIGGSGGTGGTGGRGGNGAVVKFNDYNSLLVAYVPVTDFIENGNNGVNGAGGVPASAMGNCYVLGKINLTAVSGNSGLRGKAGNFANWTQFSFTHSWTNYYVATCGGGGGGGGGAGSKPSTSIGGGGSAGGGGGGGGGGAVIFEDGSTHALDPMENAHGGSGEGGNSLTSSGITGARRMGTRCGCWYDNPYGFGAGTGPTRYAAGGDGGEAGAAGAQGADGMLYVSPTANFDIDRPFSVASTHNAAQYVIKFNANEGVLSSSANSAMATLGCELPDLVELPVRYGFLFKGWVDANNVLYYDSNGGKVQSCYAIPKNLTLYAVWAKNPDQLVAPESEFWKRENAQVGWFVDTEASNDDDNVLCSGAIDSNANSWMEATIVGPASFSFEWKVSCNTRGHYLAWLVDGVEQSRIRGEVDWTTVAASIPEGEHVVRFDYVKGSTSAAGEDKGQMRNFTINPVRIETESMQVLWDWTTNYWVSVSTTGFGSSGFESGWYVDGSNVAVSIAPSIHSYSIALSGDTDGAVLDGTNLTFQVNGAARSITASIDEVKPHLSVVSEHGTPIPAAGDHIYSFDAEVTVSVEAPASVNGVRAVCTGWTGTGSVPSSGDDSSATFVITEDSSITWNWTTAYWVSFNVAGKGTTSYESQWVVDGTNLVIPFSVNTPFYSLSLSGDSDGVILGKNSITVPVVSPRSIILNVTEYTYNTALDSVSLPWIAEGAASWIPQGNVSHDGQDAVQSGKVVGDDVSTLSTVVVGPGTLSWWWKLDMADCAGVDVFVDETLVKSLDSASDWAAASVDIAGDGEHTIRFEFWNAGTEATMSDCAHLDQVFWTGEAVNHTVTTKVPVPHSYLAMNCPALLAEHGGDYETAAKATAANGHNKVWECYVAGINPTDVAAKFTAKIEMKDGNPVITWEPNLNADGAVVRIYKVYGSETLENGGDWQSPTNSLHRFFKVGVEMP